MFHFLWVPRAVSSPSGTWVENKTKRTNIYFQIRAGSAHALCLAIKKTIDPTSQHLLLLLAASLLVGYWEENIGIVFGSGVFFQGLSNTKCLKPYSLLWYLLYSSKWRPVLKSPKNH